MLRHNRMLLIAEAVTGGVKKESLVSSFPVNFAKFLRMSFLQKTSR